MRKTDGAFVDGGNFRGRPYLAFAPPHNVESKPLAPNAFVCMLNPNDAYYDKDVATEFDDFIVTFKNKKVVAFTQGTVATTVAASKRTLAAGPGETPSRQQGSAGKQIQRGGVKAGRTTRNQLIDTLENVFTIGPEPDNKTITRKSELLALHIERTFSCKEDQIKTLRQALAKIGGDGVKAEMEAEQLEARNKEIIMTGKLTAIERWKGGGKGGRQKKHILMALHNSATEVLIGLLEKKWENIDIQDVNADQLSARTEAFRKQLCEAGTKKPLYTQNIWKVAAAQALRCYADPKFEFRSTINDKTRRLPMVRKARQELVSAFCHSFPPDPMRKGKTVSTDSNPRRKNGAGGEYVGGDYHPARSSEMWTDEELLRMLKGTEDVIAWMDEDPRLHTISLRVFRDLKCPCLQSRRRDICADPVQAHFRNVMEGIHSCCVQLYVAAEEQGEPAVGDMENLKEIIETVENEETLFDNMLCREVEFPGLVTKKHGQYRGHRPECVHEKCNTCIGSTGVFNDLVRNCTDDGDGQPTGEEGEKSWIDSENKILTGKDELQAGNVMRAKGVLGHEIAFRVWMKDENNTKQIFEMKKFTVKSALREIQDAARRFNLHVAEDLYRRRMLYIYLETMSSSSCLLVFDYSSNILLPNPQSLNSNAEHYITCEIYMALYNRKEENGHFSFTTRAFYCFTDADGEHKTATYKTHKANLSEVMKCLKEEGVSDHLFSSDRGSHYSCTSAMQGLERYARENNASVMSCFCGVGCGKCNCDALGAVVHNDLYKVNITVKKEKKKEETTVQFVKDALEAAVFTLQKGFTPKVDKVEEDKYYALKYVTPIYSTVSRAEYDKAKLDYPDLRSVLIVDPDETKEFQPFKDYMSNKYYATVKGEPGYLAQQRLFCQCPSCRRGGDDVCLYPLMSGRGERVQESLYHCYTEVHGKVRAWGLTQPFKRDVQGNIMLVEDDGEEDDNNEPVVVTQSLNSQVEGGEEELWFVPMKGGGVKRLVKGTFVYYVTSVVEGGVGRKEWRKGFVLEVSPLTVEREGGTDVLEKMHGGGKIIFATETRISRKPPAGRNVGLLPSDILEPPMVSEFMTAYVHNNMN